MGARHMTTMELQYQAQGGRCFWCAAFTLPCNLTWDHVIPRHITGLRRRQGRAGCVLAHERCNKSRGGKVIGTRRFGKWLRSILRGDKQPWQRRRRNDGCLPYDLSPLHEDDG